MTMPPSPRAAAKSGPPSSKPRDRKRERPIALLSVAALLAACGYLTYSWVVWRNSGTRYYEQGMDDASHKRYDLAEQAWLAGYKKDPHSWQCAESLGDLYTEMRRPSDAAGAYGAAATAKPDDGALFLKLATSLQTKGDIPAAYAASKRAAALSPDSAEAEGEYGLMAARSHQNHDAMAALRRALDLQPSSPVYRLALVSLEIDGLDFSRAEANLAPFLAAHPKNAEAHYLMAVVISQKPRTSANVRAGTVEAETAFSLGRRDPRLYSLLGGFFLSAGRVPGAYRVYQEGYKANPHYEPILRGYVDSATRMGRTQEAAAVAADMDTLTQRLDRIERLKNDLGFNHKNVAAALELALLNEQIGRKDQALNYYFLAWQETPGDPRIRAALAAFLRRSGQPDRAAQVMRPDFTPPAQ